MIRCPLPFRAAAVALAAVASVTVPAGAQRVAKSPPPPRTDTTHWAVIAGSDTIAVETVVRTPRRVEGDLRLLRPRVMAVQYVMWLRPDETVDSLRTTTLDASTVARGTIVIRPDSAVLTMVAPGLAAPRVDRIAVRPGTLPFINLSSGVLEQIFRRARVVGRDTVAMPILAGPQLLEARVVMVGADSAGLDLGVELRGAIDADGTLRGAVVPAQGVRFVRTEAFVPGAARGSAYGAPPGAPYVAENVTIRTPADVSLAGTLTLPRGASAARPAPVVVTISGSGAQNRDGEITGIRGYRAFRQMADTLGRRGIGVLRLDDRGAGESDVGPADVTTEDFASDVRAALAWLRARPEVDGARLGLLGHSEGGIIAPMVAADDTLVAAVALLAAPARPGSEVSAHQRRGVIAREPRIPAASRDSVFVAAQAKTDTLARSGELGAWTRFWWSYDPRPAVRRVRAPVLVLQGGTDTQVPLAHGAELASLLEASGNADVTLRTLDGLNHLFLPDPSGHADGYASLPSKAVPPAVLGIIADWFAARLGAAG